MGAPVRHDVGRFRIHLIEAGRVRLDGGAMFGVVPKPLWEKKIAPDERNRIPLAMRCALVEGPDELILIDSGAGDKEDAKFRDIYGIENDGDPTALQDGIRAAGFDPGDVGIVINTHLHFDHAGGNTVRDPAGAIRPAFPGATYVVQRGEWEFAHLQNERVKASYLLSNADPIREAGLFRFVEGESDVVPGVRVLPTPGHVPHHQSVLIESEDAIACYLADLVPTTAHLPLPWIMGYDVEPLVTLETKRRVLERARREGWLLLFEHDPEVGSGRLDPESDRPRLAGGGRS